MKEYSGDIQLSPSEPHFDDDWALRLAQPVVPLEKINARARRRRQWFLGGAFVIAMMLGAAAALLASYFKLHHTPNTVTEVSEDADAAPASLAVVDSAAAATNESENLDSVAQTAEESVPEVAPQKELPKHRTVAVKRDPEPVEPRDTQMSEEEELQRIRQAVLVDEWQERRARRVERRDRRRLERYNHRDLSNLDEIFEGRRRPN